MEPQQWPPISLPGLQRLLHYDPSPQMSKSTARVCRKPLRPVTGGYSHSPLHSCLFLPLSLCLFCSPHSQCDAVPRELSLAILYALAKDCLLYEALSESSEVSASHQPRSEFQHRISSWEPWGMIPFL